MSFNKTLIMGSIRYAKRQIELNLRNEFALVAIICITAFPGLLKSQATTSSDNTVTASASTHASEQAKNTKSITTNSEKTDPKNNEPFIMYDDVTDAQDVSLYRDGIWAKGKEKDPYYVGVYMVVDQNCSMTNEQLIPWLKKHFDHYGLPVKFVKQTKPDDGKMATARMYINGVSYDGDMSNGNISFVEIKRNHEQVFGRLKQMYEVANPPVTTMAMEPR